MTTPVFTPGFRLSLIDAVVIFVGALSSFYFWASRWTIGFVIMFVVGHFFLFCNVFRIARNLELVWAVIFCGLIVSTIAFEAPGWAITISVSLVATALVVGIEMTKPSYHGMGWSWINPNLPQWWDSSTWKYLS